MTSTADVEANLRAAKQLMFDAVGRGARLIVLPENFAFMSSSDEARIAIAEHDGRGPIQEFLQNQASVHNVWVVGGTVPIRTGAGKVLAACLVYDEAGRRVARYDKIHLFDVSIPGRDEHFRESASTEAGSDVCVIDTPIGRLGLSVCYDIRFPELYRQMADRGVEVISIPAAFTVPTGRAHWETLVRARAIENLAYVIAACQQGEHGGSRVTFGDTMIVDYWGKVTGRLASGPGVVVGEIDWDAQYAARQNFPALSHRRFKSP